jgi:hypothetical protein
MNKKWLFILAIPFFISCLSLATDWKILNLGSFTISIPKDWNYKQEQGEDSFVGEITTTKSSLHFDYSSMGYANHLIPTVDEYLKKGEWLRDCPFCKPGITYTANFNVKSEKARQMKEKGITDSTLVKVEADPDYQTKKTIHKPTPDQTKKYPFADYIADLTFKDSTIYYPIKIPVEIKASNIKIDTTDKYIVKIIWPEAAGFGITAIYIKSRTSSRNFNLVGRGLSATDQELALQVFKTIKLKD